MQYFWRALLCFVRRRLELIYPSQSCADLLSFIADSGCDPSAFARAWQVALSLASAGLAAPIASEIVHKRENLGVPCGGDALRLKVEEARLGKRILMPGDKTSGFLCFSVSAQTTLPDSLDVKITIPVVTKAPEEVSGQVEVRASLLK